MARIAAKHAREVVGRRPSPLSAFLVALLAFSLLLFLVLHALGIFSLPDVSGNVGHAAVELLQHPSAEEEARKDGVRRRGEQWTEVLSWEPRVFIYYNLLSKEECEHLIELAKPHMRRSRVIDSVTGRSMTSRRRTSTSSGNSIRRGQDEIIRAIEKRIADFTFIPIEQGDHLQVIHYEVGQKTEPHFDYFSNELNTRNGGQRIATVLMYLSDVEEGGETVFPSAKVNSSSLPWHDELSECGKKGLSVKPEMGDALLFWNTRPDTSLDPSSLHGGCPVTRGSKWACTKWIHAREYKD